MDYEAKYGMDSVDLLFHSGRYEEAIEELSQDLSQNENAYARLARGSFLLYIGRYADALDDYLLAREKLLDSVIHEIGVCYWCMGDRSTAIREWTELADARRTGEIVYGRYPCAVDTAALLWWGGAVSGETQYMNLAKKELGRLSRTKACSFAGWPRSIVLLLLNALGESDVVKSADFDVPIVRERRLCQAYFHIATRRLTQGDHLGYMAALGMVLCQGLNIQEPEYHLARFELQSTGIKEGGTP